MRGRSSNATGEGRQTALELDKRFIRGEIFEDGFAEIFRRETPFCECIEDHSSVDDRDVREHLKNDFVVPSDVLPWRILKACERI